MYLKIGSVDPKKSTIISYHVTGLLAEAVIATMAKQTEEGASCKIKHITTGHTVKKSVVVGIQATVQKQHSNEC